MGVVEGSILDGLTKEQISWFVEAEKQAHANKSRLCLNPKCSKLANSHNHLLQTGNNGLEALADNTKNIWAPHHDSYQNSYVFLKRSVYKSLGFKGFCSDCDNNIFARIEKIKPDFSDPHSVCLYSLRAYFCERRKQDIRLEMSKILLNKNLPQHVFDHINVVDLESYEKIKTFDLYNRVYLNPDQQIFKHRTISNLRIACSTIASIGFGYTGLGLRTTHTYFFHVIPYKNESHVIISTDRTNADTIKSSNFKGYIPREFYIRFHSLDKSAFKKHISDLLLRYTENWIVSDNFYQEFIATRKEKVSEELRKGITTDYKFKQFWDDPKFNLFDPAT